MLTAFGATAVTFMMVMYALESRGRGFVLAFACGCALSSAYGFLAGTWPFGVVEAIWAVIALRRYRVLPGHGWSRRPREHHASCASPARAASQYATTPPPTRAPAIASLLWMRRRQSHMTEIELSHMGETPHQFGFRRAVSRCLLPGKGRDTLAGWA